MAKLLKLRRGTTSQHSSFTGAEGELTVDTTKDTTVVHDGSTTGGHPLLREDLDNMPASGVSAGTYGSSSAIPALTVDVKGRVTGATTTAIDSTAITNGSASVAVASNGPITATGNLDVTAGVDVTGNITVSGTVDGRNLSTDGSKLDGIESGATADQSAAEIRSLVESASDSNVFTDADHSKLNGIEASADVTDATNVNAAGAVMNSDTSTGSMSFVVDEDNMSSNSATKVPTQQSVKTYVDTEVAGVIDSAPGALNTLNELAAALGDDASFSTTVTNSIATKLPKSGGQMTGNITFSGSQTVDGRDLSSDGSKLDGIASGAQVNVATNLGKSTSTTSNTITSSTGSNVTINEATGSAAGLMSSTHHNKLDGIASGATNVTNNNQLTNGRGFITAAQVPASITYQTGTWTPQVYGSSYSGVNVYDADHYAEYTRIGNTVWLRFNIAWRHQITVPTSESVRIHGLPFTVPTYHYQGGVASWTSGILPSNYGASLLTVPGTTQLQLQVRSSSGGWSWKTRSGLSYSCLVGGQLHYRIS